MTSLFSRSLRRSSALLVCAPVALLGTALVAAPVWAAVVTDPPAPAALPEAGASSPLLALAYSPDGATIYTLGENGEFLGRDTKTGATRFRGDLGPMGARLQVLADGSILVARVGATVELYAKPTNGQPLRLVQTWNKPELGGDKGDEPTLFGRNLTGFVLSPDGKSLATVTTETGFKLQADGPPLREPGAVTARVKVWNVADGTLSREVLALPLERDTPRKPAAGVPKVAWSDASTLVVAASDVSLQRYDTATGAVKNEWKPPAEGMLKPDQAAEDAEWERRMKMLPEAMQERMRNAPRRPAQGDGATGFGTLQGVSSDGNFVLALTRRGFQLWDTRDNSYKVLEKSMMQGGGDVSFARDGSLVAVRGGTIFRLWKTDGTQVGMGRTSYGDATDLSFAPNSQTLALAEASGTTRLWSTGAPLDLNTAPTSTLAGYFAPWKRLEPSPTGLFGATAQNVAVLDAKALAGKGGVRWFNNPPLESPVKLPTTSRQNVVGMAPSPDGKFWVESVSIDKYDSSMSQKEIPRGELRARDVQTGEVLWRQSDGNVYSTVALLRFLPDGTLLTGKGGGGGVRLRGATFDDTFLGLQARNGLTGDVKDFDFNWGDTNGEGNPYNIEILEPSADGTALVVSSGGGGNGVQTLDLATRTVRQFFWSNTDVPKTPWSLAPDGKLLAGPSRTRGTLGVWDVTTKRGFGKSGPEMNFKLSPSAAITAVKFGINGTLAVGLADGRVLAWAPGFATDAPATWETGTGRAITAITFSDDGKTLWSGDERGDLKARDAQSGALKTTLRLLPPDGATPAWVKWDAAGKIEKSTP